MYVLLHILQKKKTALSWGKNRPCETGLKIPASREKGFSKIIPIIVYVNQLYQHLTYINSLLLKKTTEILGCPVNKFSFVI